jgi:tetratricopeptide (TPR) repeat protein
MKTFRAALVVPLLSLLLALPVAAEETAPSIDSSAPPPVMSKAARIDSLFETLKVETDASAAKETEQAILRLWLESGSDTVDLLMQWSLSAMEKKDYPRALDFLDRIVLLAPDYAEGWNKRATVYFLMDDYGKSITDIGRVLELEPRHFGALSGLGMIMRAIGDDKRAIAAYKAALTVDPHLDNVQEALDELEAKTGGQDI